MEDVIRIGTISTVDVAQGTAQVYYQDRDSTTGQLHFWSEADPPPAGVKYQKELIPGITESVQEAEYKLTAPGITFQSGAGSITVAELIELRSKVKELEEKI